MNIHSVAHEQISVKAIRRKNRAALQRTDQQREAVACVADHLCYAVALGQLGQLSDARLLERSAAIVAAVLGLTRPTGGAQ